MKKPSRYTHQRQDWNLNNMDTFPNCEKEVVICPQGYPGHKVYWLNTSISRHIDGELNFDVVVRIEHSHFVRNRDTGRHVDDIIGHKWIPERYTVITRRLDYAQLPEWIMDENESSIEL